LMKGDRPTSLATTFISIVKNRYYQNSKAKRNRLHQ
jgi:hypothetical protein